MREIWKRFTREDGGISVDWVVLTAAIIGLMLSAALAFSDATKRHAALTSQTMHDRPVGSGF